MKTDLIVIWTTGEKERHAYPTEEAAQKAGEGYKKAFGNQIQWTGTTPHREPQTAPQPDRIEATARRVINLDFFGMRDAGQDAENIADDLKKRPLDVINYLLDYIEANEI